MGIQTFKDLAHCRKVHLNILFSSKNELSKKLQLTDTLTYIIGGNAFNKRLITFDWNTKSYTMIPTLLINVRIASGCAILKDVSGKFSKDFFYRLFFE